MDRLDRERRACGDAAITTLALIGVALAAAVVPALQVRKTDTGLALRAGI